MGYSVLVRLHLYIESGPCSFLVQRPVYSNRTRSIAWLLVCWPLMSPGYQQSRYWLCMMDELLSKLRPNGSNPLIWRHNGPDGVPNHQPQTQPFVHGTDKKTSKHRASGLCAGNSPVTGEFSAQRAGTAENISIWWRNFAATLLCQWVIETSNMFASSRQFGTLW